MKELMNKLADLPNAAKAALAAAVVALAFLAGLAGRYAIWLVLTILILFALVVGGYLLWQAWKRRQDSALFTSEMKQQSAAAPRGISDPGKLRDLDNLRRRFEEGVNEYKSRGKDLYSLPWFLFAGESGSGKTEAIRHSNVGFPPGMQDEMQGAGGTVNMDWWFTDRGVFLDTAGRLIVEEVKPGETSEWREFLKLLKRSRPNCPINGLLLVIPCDSLLKDSLEKIKTRAGQIARQLDVIQRTLDIRFPVTLLITKCDLLVGFREFSESITDPVLQHQMMGWSNPDPLDVPFRAELLDQHLKSVADRLQRRVLGLLRDPVSANAPNRRLSEVDALYALPKAIVTDITPNLRRYLETIFVAGQWSAKPLFLRGVYFSSALREGSVLDKELEGVLEIKLPQGRVWERERPFFLRDIFMEKVFREKGLVTRATNAAEMLRRRRIIQVSSGVGALVLFLLIAWLGVHQLQLSVRGQSATWKAAVKPVPIVEKASRDGEYVYQGDKMVATGEGTVVDFQDHLVTLAKSKLKTGWVFRPISWVVRDLNRRRAQRLVFERDVLLPLVKAARDKMVAPPRSDSAELRTAQTRALLVLVQIETGILNRQDDSKRGTLATPDDARKYLEPLLAYVAGAKVDPKLARTMAWTYSRDGDGRGEWPPARLSGGASLMENSPIHGGLDQIAGRVLGLPLGGQTNTPAMALSVDQLKHMRDAMPALEAELVSAAKRPALAGGHEEDLERYAGRISRLGLIARALLDSNDAPITCKIRLDQQQDASTARAYHYLEVVSGKCHQKLDTTKTSDQPIFCEPQVDRPVEVKAYSYIEHLVSSRQFPVWGPIALLVRYREGAKLSPGGKAWMVRYPVATNESGSASISLLIEFDQPLPELAQWLAP